MLNPNLQYSTANGATISDEALMEAITEHRPEALSEFVATKDNFSDFAEGRFRSGSNTRTFAK